MQDLPQGESLTGHLRVQPEAHRLSAGLTLLLVDDDDLLRKAMAHMLQLLGHSVRAEDGGRAALAALERPPLPELVMLDVNMPDMNGLETLSEMRRRHPRLPVLLATGYLEPEAEAVVEADPYTWCITKPFMLDEVQRAFGQMMGR